MRIFIGLLAIVVLLVSIACGFQDYPDSLPPGHHRTSAEYYWKVVIDKVDENRVYYTDSQPVCSTQITSEDQQQTFVCIGIVCMDSPRQPREFAKDIFYTDRLCDGGEGKIQIIPQGSIVKY